MIKSTVQMRFGDFDIAGHAHNACYLHLFESGRINFFVAGLGKDWDWNEHGLIVKKNVVEYHSPIEFQPEVDLEVWCSHIGNTSFTLAYKVLSKDGTLRTTGESVLVCFDYKAGTKISIPADMKAHLEAHQS